MRRVPIYGRRCGKRDIVAYAIVDDEDYSKVSSFKWNLQRKSGYAKTNPDGPTIMMHRLILGLVPGDGVVVDHKNHKRRDNRKNNLIRGTKLSNCNNRKKPGARVYYEPNNVRKWYAKTSFNYKPYYLGSFKLKADAKKAVRQWRAKHGQRVDP